VQLAAKEKTVVEALKKRTMSDPSSDPTTGAELGMGEAAAPGTKRPRKT
jgi:Mn-containing catalase